MKSDGFCQCGCGGETTLSARYHGVLNKFIRGHQNRRERHRKWNGGAYQLNTGYIVELAPEHPRAYRGGYVRRALLIVEKALGKYLPMKAEIHHFNKVRNDDSHQNLVVCQDRAYHRLLHVRQEAVAAGFPATWRTCCFCKKYDTPENLTKSARHHLHRDCQSRYMKIRHALKKGEKKNG